MPKLTKKLTDAVMRSLKPPARGNVLHYDPELEGFAGRVTAKNAKAFVLVYHFERLEHRDTVGGWPEWSADAARERAKEWKRGLSLGISPRGKPPAPATDTLKARIEQYLADPRSKRTKRPLRPSTLRTYRRALRQYATPLHHRPLQEIRRREVAELLDEINRTRGSSTAMLTRTALGRLYTWAMARDYAEYNPVAGTEGWQGGERDRTLPDDELRLVWRGTAGEDPSGYYTIVRLLIRLGLRPQEAGSLSTDEVKDDAIELPADYTKNWLPLLLPIPYQVRRDLGAQERTNGKHFFGIRGKKGFSGGSWSEAKQALDLRIAKISAEQRLGRPLAEGEKPEESDFLPAWQHRDLRRTVETRLAKLGVRQEVINRLLNHAIGSITTVYNQHEYYDEKKAALQKWSDELDRIVGEPAPGSDQADRGADEPAPDNVVPMTARR
jgi:integrase